MTARSGVLMPRACHSGRTMYSLVGTTSIRSKSRNAMTLVHQRVRVGLAPRVVADRVEEDRLVGHGLFGEGLLDHGGARRSIGRQRAGPLGSGCTGWWPGCRWRPGCGGRASAPATTCSSSRSGRWRNETWVYPGRRPSTASPRQRCRLRHEVRHHVHVHLSQHLVVGRSQRTVGGVDPERDHRIGARAGAAAHPRSRRGLDGGVHHVDLHVVRAGGQESRRDVVHELLAQGVAGRPVAGVQEVQHLLHTRLDSVRMCLDLRS